MQMLINMGACVGVASLVNSPIGVAGGALYGGIWTFTRTGAESLIGNCEGKKTNANVYSTALAVITAWKLAGLCGVSISLPLATLCGVVSIFACELVTANAALSVVAICSALFIININSKR